jgi:hypothetical protein
LFSFLAGTTTAAIAVLIVLLTKWNIILILRKEVKRRTRELEESYDDMKQYLDTVLAELMQNESTRGKYRK